MNFPLLTVRSNWRRNGRLTCRPLKTNPALPMTGTQTDDDRPLVLIVDDEKDLLDLLSYNFQQDGYRVTTARDGVEALDLARETPPDLIVLDIMMPRMDGIEACRRIRSDAVLRKLPIIMLTAKTEEDNQIEVLDYGTVIYLSKPISVYVLLIHCRVLLR